MRNQPSNHAHVPELNQNHAKTHICVKRGGNMKSTTIQMPETAKEAVDFYTRRGLELIAQMHQERDKIGAANPQTLNAYTQVVSLLGQAVIDIEIEKIRKQGGKRNVQPVYRTNVRN